MYWYQRAFKSVASGGVFCCKLASKDTSVAHYNKGPAPMSIKLQYFNIRGRGEPIRLVLHAAKKNFEDVRIEKADWPAIKPTTPHGTLPVLTLDGEQYSQGMILAAYLAKTNGLFGSKDKDYLEIGMIQSLREDLLIEEIKMFKESDEKKQEEMRNALVEVSYPRYFGYFEKILEKNKDKNKSDFAVGKEFTLADIVIFEGTQTCYQTNPDLLNKYPLITALRGRVQERDGIKQYLAIRQQTGL